MAEPGQKPARSLIQLALKATADRFVDDERRAWLHQVRAGNLVVPWRALEAAVERGSVGPSHLDDVRVGRSGEAVEVSGGARLGGGDLRFTYRVLPLGLDIGPRIRLGLRGVAGQLNGAGGPYDAVCAAIAVAVCRVFRGSIEDAIEQGIEDRFPIEREGRDLWVDLTEQPAVVALRGLVRRLPGPERHLGDLLACRGIVVQDDGLCLEVEPGPLARMLLDLFDQMSR